MLNASVFAGLPLASLALLWANRLVPLGVEERALVEGWVFVGAWLLAALWAGVNRRDGRRLLRQQLSLGALLALGLPLLNAFTTDGHLLASLTRGDWALASVDLFLLIAGAICALYAWRMKRAPVSTMAVQAKRIQEA